MRGLVIVIVVVAAMAVGLFSFSHNSSLAQPVVILDGLRSGDTEQAVRNTLSNYKLHEDERTLENQYHKSHVILSVENYQTANCTGKLLVQFYDGGLYDVWFYPDDTTSYLAQLKKEGIDLAQLNQIRRDGLKIWYMRDGESKQYVGREDLDIGHKIEDITD